MNKSNEWRIASFISVALLILVSVFVIISTVKLVGVVRADKEKLENIISSEMSIIDDNMLDITSLESFKFVEDIGGLGKATQEDAKKIIQLTINDLNRVKETRELLNEDLKTISKQIFEINKMEKELNNLTLSKKDIKRGQEHIDKNRGSADFNKMFIQDDFKMLIQLEYKLLDLQSRASFVR